MALQLHKQRSSQLRNTILRFAAVFDPQYYLEMILSTSQQHADSISEQTATSSCLDIIHDLHVSIIYRKGRGKQYSVVVDIERTRPSEHIGDDYTVVGALPVNPPAPGRKYIDEVFSIIPDESKKLFRAMDELAMLTGTYIVFDDSPILYEVYTSVNRAGSRARKPDAVPVSKADDMMLERVDVDEVRANMDKYLLFGACFAKPEIVLDNLVSVTVKKGKSNILVYAVRVNNTLVPLAFINEDVKLVTPLVADALKL